MALPRVNETLNFTMKIPSTGQRVKYRPYLVKEEKILLQAFESGDVATCLEAMVDTLGACIDKKDNLDVYSLATFDVEYMFTQVRGKSVGESSTILINCKECAHQNQYVVDLDKLEVDVKNSESVINITDDIAVEMKYPTYRTLTEGDIDKIQKEDTDAALQVIAASISAVLTEHERIECSQQDPKEVLEFINSMTASQIKKVSGFLEEMPSLHHEGSFECEKCQTQNEVELRGLSDFF